MAQQTLASSANTDPPTFVAASLPATRKTPEGPRVVRVKGIPAGPIETAKKALGDYIREQLEDAEREKVKFRPTIVHACESNKLVGLVDFTSKELPAFLSNLWQRSPKKFIANDIPGFNIDRGPDDVTDLTFDTDFLGFTQLYDPSPLNEEVADIIALHGINGHSFGTWRSRDNPRKMWLRDSLKEELPRCRTMIYGYSASLYGQTVGDIDSYAKKFLNDLEAIRRTKQARQRPIFFIAHSFGGILLTRALIKAAQYQDDHNSTDRAVYKATYGLMFFAVPHRGMDFLDMRLQLQQQGHSMVHLFDQLDRGSDVLGMQRGDLVDLIGDRKIVSFLEMDRQGRLELTKDGWSRSKTTYDQTLGHESAALGLPRDMEKVIPMPGETHSSVAKLDENTEGYGSALTSLTGWLDDAPRVVKSRFSEVARDGRQIFNVPFPRDPSFVGREDILRQVKRAFDPAGHCRAALYGLSGMGKSQIIIEFCYRLQEIHPSLWLFWVDARNEALFMQSLGSIAKHVGIPVQSNHETLLQTVQDWLSKEANGSWLMVLDNADDQGVLYKKYPLQISYGDQVETSEKALMRFIPKVSHGSLLAASCWRDIALGLADSNLIKVDKMSDEECYELFRRKLPAGALNAETKEAQIELRLLTWRAGGTPMTIRQAAANIRLRDLSVSQYLEEQWSDSQRKTMLAANHPDIRREDERQNAVLYAYNATFDAISKLSPIAADFMFLMCLFITGEILPRSLVYGESDAHQADVAIKILADASFINVALNGNISMHSMVQEATRYKLKDLGEEEKYKTMAVQHLVAAFPEFELLRDSNLDSSSRLQVCETYYDRTRYGNWHCTDKLAEARLREKEGICEMLMNNIERARGSFTSSLHGKRDALQGNNDFEVLESIWNLAKTHSTLGEWDEAEKLLQQIIETCSEDDYSKRSMLALSAYLEISQVYRRKAAFGDCEAALTKAIEKSRYYLFGADHGITTVCRLALANILSLMNMPEKAEAVLNDVRRYKGKPLEEIKEKLRQDRPSRGNHLHAANLILVEALERLDDDPYQQYLPKIISGLVRLIRANRTSGLRGVMTDVQQAIFHARNLSSMQVLQYDVQVIMIQLAQLCRHFEQWKDEEELRKRVLDSTIKVYGTEHKDTLVAKSNLATCYTNQGKNKEAREVLRHIVKAAEKKFGERDTRTLLIKKNKATLELNTGHYRKAIKILEKVCQLWAENRGLDDPKTKEMLTDLEVWRKEYKAIPFIPCGPCDKPRPLTFRMQEIQRELQAGAKP